MVNIARLFFKTPFVIVLLLGIVWSAAALYFDSPTQGNWPLGFAVGFFLSALLITFLARSFLRAIVAITSLCLLVALWWSTIMPSNQRPWIPDVENVASAVVEGDKLTIRNVRNFSYTSETDFTPQWETRNYDLSKITGLDMYFSYWSGPTIAHTILSWEFDHRDHLAISIETRREVGEEYSAVKGFFRQFEIYYVVADERDLIRLRTNFRKEQVYLYRLQVSPELARHMLLDYIDTINGLAVKPVWYNALTQNCTTTIRQHSAHLGYAGAFNWRIFANGYLDQLLYQRQLINNSLPFSQLREASMISTRGIEAQETDFSSAIRRGLPGIVR
jgi:hypothetical protein